MPWRGGGGVTQTVGWWVGVTILPIKQKKTLENFEKNDRGDGGVTACVITIQPMKNENYEKNCGGGGAVTQLGGGDGVTMPHYATNENKRKQWDILKNNCR